jgi:hypothetical protein
MVDSTPAPSKSISVKEKRQQLWQPTTWHQTFPFKLYEMLQYACNSEFRSALSWLAEGNAFIIHDKNVLMNGLAPMFFKQTQFRSFVSVLQATRCVLFHLWLDLVFAQALITTMQLETANPNMMAKTMFNTFSIWL